MKLMLSKAPSTSATMSKQHCQTIVSTKSNVASTLSNVVVMLLLVCTGLNMQQHQR